MRQALVLGTGQMGRAIAFGLHHQGIETHTVDSVSQPYDGEHLKYHHTLDVSDPLELSDALNIIANSSNSVVVSSLPYYLNTLVADACINRDLAYCDLGGHVGTSNYIRNAALYSSRPMSTDLGLAPGLVNIIAYHKVINYIEYHEKPPTNVYMMVGGLPTDPQGPLKYKVTWSTEGLINEYVDDCEILRDGKLILKAGLSGLEDVDFEDWEGNKYELECFRTSGGASHSIKELQELGVQNCEYKTLRYRGHRDKLLELICDNELENIVDEHCHYESNDLVIVRAGTNGNMTHMIHKGNDKFSAMQMMTAFPIAAVAAQITEGKYDKLKVIGYKDIHYDDFMDKFAELHKMIGD